MRVSWSAILGVAVGFGLILSGCLSSPGGGSVAPSSSGVNPRLPPGADPDKGALEGEVVGGAGEPLAGVQLILGTDPGLETESDATGYFVFLNVTGGHYVLRAEAMDYEPLETHVNVSVGEIEWLGLTLIPLDPGRGEHVHDYWFEDGKPVSRRDLYNGTLQIPGLIDGPAERELTCASGPALKSLIDKIMPRNSCYQIPIVPEGPGPQDGIVWPGTRALEINVTFKSNPLVPLYFTYAAANNTSKEYKVNLSKSPASFSIPVEPVMTDGAHQHFTIWIFRIIAKISAGKTEFGDIESYNGDLIQAMIGPVSVSIVGVKGIVQLDPPHPDYWKDGGQMELVNEIKILGESLTYERRPDQENSSIAFRLPTGKIVPPGTTRIKVSLEYKDPNYNLGQYFTKKSLAFRTASMNPATVTLGELKNPLHDMPLGRTTWDYPLLQPSGSDELPETDPHYKKSSLWLFLLANQDKEHDDRFLNECYGASTCGGIHYHLTVVAINENWKPN